MNEDEAFIRAIVDSPGDDTARLVYADWLDERDDPRGKYLRGELEWAATHDPSERDTLRQLAKQLDPVWVARVSRPPLGVCCDHFVWTNRGAHGTSADLDSFEREIRTPLPPAYRAFIRNNNGAELDVSDEHDGGWRFHPLDVIREIRASGQSRVDGRESSSEAAQWLRQLLWIGQGFEIIDQLMLGLSGPECGMICVIDSQVPLNTNYEWYLSGYKPHTTFAGFLSLLPKGFPVRGT